MAAEEVQVEVEEALKVLLKIAQEQPVDPVVVQEVIVVTQAAPHYSLHLLAVVLVMLVEPVLLRETVAVVEQVQ